MNSPDLIERLNAALDGRYRVERELGEGGMATVYLAADLKHERSVALKVLKPELAAVVGAERFLAEIKTTANLQHPHILPLFYVEGETLRGRLDREKQLGVEDALGLAAKLCDALDYAHAEGVIHRDIKPANILLSKRGEPLVADFGIALAVAQAGGGRITETGLSLGTPHYMSPEQATGDSEVDPRSDVYALGCVVYEMLAGEPPFTATTAQAVLAKILTMDAPSVTMVRRTVPPNVSAAVAKALEKLPADRFTSVSDFGAALRDEGFTYAARTRVSRAQGGPRASTGAAPRSGDRRPLVLASSVAVLASLLAGWGWLSRPPAPAPAVATRTALTTGNVHWVQISPDGRLLMAKPVDGPDLLVREAADLEWRPVPGSQGASRNMASSFSPDGAWLLVSQGQEGLSKLPVSGGPSQPVSEGVRSTGHWSDEEAIVYDDGRSAVYRVAASGGAPELLFDSDTLGFQHPYLLPGGRGVLVTTRAADPLNSRILVYDLEAGELRERVASATHARYVPTGHLVYTHGSGALIGVSFDLESLQVTGHPSTLLPDLSLGLDGAGRYSISETGTLVYGVDRAPDSGPLAWLDEGGRLTPIPIEPESAARPRISPDGASIAYEGDGQIWIHDVVRGIDRQFTFGSVHTSPIWSPDGRHVYFVSDAVDGGRWTLMRRVVDGSSEPEEVREVGTAAGLTSMSPDGRRLVFDTGAGGGATGIRLVDLEAETGTPPAPYLPDDVVGAEAAVSPDGAWLVYLQGGDVFVRGFPAPSGLWRVAAGREPIWAADGRAIYFWDAGIWGVDVRTEPTFSLGSPYLVAPDVRLVGGRGVPWDAHPDGTRFVVARPGAGGLGDLRFYIVTNWFTELLELMGEDGR
jgi:serine/threonine-protein kinase